MNIYNTDSVLAVAWSPDGRYLASSGYDQVVRLSDPAGNQLLAALGGHTNSVLALAWSPDSRRLASASTDQTIWLWNVVKRMDYRPDVEGRTADDPCPLEGHTDSVSALAWSPDGRRLASASYDHTVRLWDVQHSRLLAILEGHENWVRAVAWSPDSRRLVSASNDQTVRLWDAEGFQLLATLKGHTNYVNAIAWSPGGRRLASVSGDLFSDEIDDTVRVWWVGDGL